MKNKKSTIKTSILIALFFLALHAGIAQNLVLNTAGEVTFSVKTVTANGNFAPRHVLAIWVEDNNGFVKTRLVRANNRKQYLYTWKTVSGNNETDATTGATRTSHITENVVWDCTDLDGNVLPDGEYTIHIEFTEEHAQGPLSSVTFTKGTEEQHLTPADEAHFINIMLDYIPEITGLNENPSEELVRIYPNPGNGIYYLDCSIKGNIELSVLDSRGRLCLNNELNIEGLSNQHEINLSSLKNGIYFVKISGNSQSITTKIVKQ